MFPARCDGANLFWLYVFGDFWSAVGIWDHRADPLIGTGLLSLATFCLRLCFTLCQLSSGKMSASPIFVLPGLDGSDLLLRRFVDLAPPEVLVKILSLPDDSRADYEALATRFATMIGTTPCHLIAESFSGPIGILLAYRFPEVVSRLTLVASFAKTPTSTFARYLPWSLLFRLPMPRIIAKKYFVGAAPSLIPTLQTAVRTSSVSTLVRRIQCVMDVDVTHEFSQVACPIDYVRPSKDRLIPERAFRGLLKVNPNTYVIPIDGPHLILQTRPRETWAGILGRAHDNDEK